MIVSPPVGRWCAPGREASPGAASHRCRVDGHTSLSCVRVAGKPAPHQDDVVVVARPRVSCRAATGCRARLCAVGHHGSAGQKSGTKVRRWRAATLLFAWSVAEESSRPARRAPIPSFPARYAAASHRCSPVPMPRKGENHRLAPRCRVQALAGFRIPGTSTRGRGDGARSADETTASSHWARQLPCPLILFSRITSPMRAADAPPWRLG
jgi:hypothetical protein